MCNCGKFSQPKNNVNKASAPTITNGTNQKLLRQISEQAKQQKILQEILNPSRTAVKYIR